MSKDNLFFQSETNKTWVQQSEAKMLSHIDLIGLFMYQCPTVCATPITVMGSVMGLFPLRNGVYLVTAIK